MGIGKNNRPPCYFPKKDFKKALPLLGIPKVFKRPIRAPQNSEQSINRR